MNQAITKLIDYDALERWYLHSNTPAYLYRHFRDSERLSRLADDWGQEWLIQEYGRRTAAEKLSLEDVVVAYAIIVAFTHLPYDRAIEMLSRIDMSRLDWAEALRTLFVNSTEPTRLTRPFIPLAAGTYFITSGTAQAEDAVLCSGATRRLR